MARILQVCNSDFYLNRFLAPLVMGLTARGHSVECVCEGGDIDPRFRQAGVVMHDFRFPKTGSPLAFWRAIRRMRSLLRNGKYHCVNSHNRNASIVARVAARLERVPVNLYTAHGFYFHDAQPAWLREATVQVEKALGRITHFTLSQSAEDVELAVRRRIVGPDRICHIGNGIDVTRFGARFERNAIERRLGLSHGTFRIATAGRLVKGKGFDDLAVAFARFSRSCPNSQLVIIGGNIAQDIQPYQRQFAALVRGLTLETKVLITGIVDHVEKYLGAADLFVLPSYREGMPRSLIEAMAMGLVCIATDIRGSREIILNGVTGFLYPPGDLGALGELLERTYRNPQERAAIGAKAREAAVKDYDETMYVARQILAIEKLV